MHNVTITDTATLKSDEIASLRNLSNLLNIFLFCYVSLIHICLVIKHLALPRRVIIKCIFKFKQNFRALRYLQIY